MTPRNVGSVLSHAWSDRAPAHEIPSDSLWARVQDRRRARTSRQRRRRRASIGVAAALGTLAIAGAAARPGLQYFLTLVRGDETSYRAVTPGPDGDVSLTFVDESGAVQHLQFGPDDVGEDGVIEGFEWSRQDPDGATEDGAQ